MALNLDPLLVMAQKAIQTTAQETAAQQKQQQQQQQATTSIAQKAIQTTAQETAAQQKRQAAADRFKLAAQSGVKRGILASQMRPQMPAQTKL